MGKVSWSDDDKSDIPYRGGLSNLWPPPVECVHTATSRLSEREQKTVTGSKVEGEEEPGRRLQGPPEEAGFPTFSNWWPLPSLALLVRRMPFGAIMSHVTPPGVQPLTLVFQCHPRAPKSVTPL